MFGLDTVMEHKCGLTTLSMTVNGKMIEFKAVVNSPMLMGTYMKENLTVTKQMAKESIHSQTATSTMDTGPKISVMEKVN